MVEKLTFTFYVVALGFAVVRQIAMWLSGWKSYGAMSVWQPFNDVAGDFAPWVVRCKKHEVAQHPTKRSFGGRQDTLRKDYAVQPAGVGTRHWSYEARGGAPIGKTRWVGKCLRLALFRRFREPAIETCPWCEFDPRHDKQPNFDELVDRVLDEQQPAEDELDSDAP